jgi:hypothetical protein
MYAFLSYQTEEKLVAAAVRALLEKLGIKSFMAHEDIQVSHEWRLKILEEIGKADMFIPLLSAAYRQSDWCMQESGIAAHRNMCIIPLSLDGTIPPGFIGHVQSSKINPANITVADLLPGLAKADIGFAIDAMIKNLKGSASFRGAEANFGLLLPYLGQATDEQIVRILKVSQANGQICHAGLCAHEYLPPLLASHGHLLDPVDKESLAETLAAYA